MSSNKQYSVGETTSGIHEIDTLERGHYLEQRYDLKTGTSPLSATDEIVSPEVLEHALESLETQKTAWYAYFTTKDFWLVLALGLVPTRF